MVDLVKIREVVRKELHARYNGSPGWLQPASVEDAIVAAFKVAFDVTPKPAKPCPTPFLVGGDEYLCDRCGIRWDIREEKPGCPRST